MPDTSLQPSSTAAPTSTTPSSATNSDPQLHGIVRKLAHDLRSPLSIMAMGIEAVRALKSDPEQIEAICDMMAQQGIEPMKNMITEMVDSHSPR